MKVAFKSNLTDSCNVIAIILIVWWLQFVIKCVMHIKSDNVNLSFRYVRDNCIDHVSLMFWKYFRVITAANENKTENILTRQTISYKGTNLIETFQPYTHVLKYWFDNDIFLLNFRDVVLEIIVRLLSHWWWKDFSF